MPRPIHAVDPKLSMPFDGSLTCAAGMAWNEQNHFRTTSLEAPLPANALPTSDIRSAGRTASWRDVEQQSFADDAHKFVSRRQSNLPDDHTYTALSSFHQFAAVPPDAHGILDDSQTPDAWDSQLWEPSTEDVHSQLVHMITSVDSSGRVMMDVSQGSCILTPRSTSADSPSWTMVDAGHGSFVLTPLSSPSMSTHPFESPIDSHPTPRAASCAALLALRITEAADGMAEGRSAEADHGSIPYAAFRSPLASSQVTPHLVTPATPELAEEWALPMSPMSTGPNILTPDDQVMEGSQIDEVSLLGYRGGRLCRGPVSRSAAASIAATASSSRLGRNARLVRRSKRAIVSDEFDIVVAPTGQHKCSKGCGKGFKRKEHCRRHEETHLPPEKKPLYKCDVCGSTLTRNDNLKDHRRKHGKPGGKIKFVEGLSQL